MNTKENLKTAFAMCIAVLLAGVAIWSIYSTYWAIQTLKTNVANDTAEISKIEYVLTHPQVSPSQK